MSKMHKVKIVGVLNLTPDSFSGDGLTDTNQAISQAEDMFKQGVSIIDIGAESTRPGATPLSSDEEWARLEPVFTVLVNKYPDKISLDSYHPETVRKALAISDKFIVNDVTGLNGDELKSIVIKNKLKVIVSHFPKSLGVDIQSGHQPENKIDSFDQVKNELLERRQELIDAGLEPNQIIIDPGIGFGKTIELNEKLLEFASSVTEIDVLIGYSKKSFMGDERMTVERNLESGRKAIKSGAKYLRLHADLINSHKSLI